MDLIIKDFKKVQFKDYKNKIIFGDALKVLKNFPDNFIECIVTSPPYFVNKEYEELRKDINIINTWNNYCYAFLLPIFKECYRVLRPGCSMWINIDDSHTSIKSELKKNIILPTHAVLILELSKILQYKALILWKKVRKKNASGGANRMLGSYGRFGSPGSIPIAEEVEYILWFKKDGIRKDITDNLRKQSALTSKEFSTYGMQIWEFQPERDRRHPAPFPKELPKRCIKLSSFKNDIILDPFAGKFTTGRVAYKYDRNFIGIEKEWHYCKLAESEIISEMQLNRIFQ